MANPNTNTSWTLSSGKTIGFQAVVIKGETLIYVNIDGKSVNPGATMYTEIDKTFQGEKIAAKMGKLMIGEENFPEIKRIADYAAKKWDDDMEKRENAKKSYDLNKNNARDYDNLHNEGGEGYNPYRK